MSLLVYLKQTTVCVKKLEISTPKEFWKHTHWLFCTEMQNFMVMQIYIFDSLYMVLLFLQNKMINQ